MASHHNVDVFGLCEQAGDKRCRHRDDDELLALHLQCYGSISLSLVSL